jgi:hypothetical protein
VSRIEVARADAVDGRCRQPGVHGSGALVGGLAVRGNAEEHRENEPKDPSDREPTRASQTQALPFRG